MLYSASTQGFYDTKIHKSIPKDVKTVSQDDYLALLTANRSGKNIIPDADGYPIAAEPTVTIDQLRAENKALAKKALSVTDMVALRCFKVGIAYPSEWRSYAHALRIIVSAEDLDPDTGLPEQPGFPAES